MFARPSNPVIALAVALVLSGCMGGSGSSGANTPPTALLVIKETDQELVFELDASGSTDPDGDALTYHWNWVLGSNETTSPRALLEWPPEAAAGNAAFPVTVTVRDSRGGAGWALAPLTFGTGVNQGPTLTVKPATRWVEPNTEVTLDASDSVDPDGDPMAFEWIWGPLGNYDENARGPEDPCLANSTANAVFTSGCLLQDQSFDITFSEPGTYNYHCHPHPWMKARLIVDETVQPTGPVTIDIANFDFSEEVLTIGMGSTVTFVNRDPTVHSATLEDYTPGSDSGGTTDMFTETLPAGEYIARLIVTDTKGDRTTQTWGLKSSDDAVPNPDVRTNESTQPLAHGSSVNVREEFMFNYRIAATLTWNDPSGDRIINASLILGEQQNNDFKIKQNCPGVYGSGIDESDPANSVTINCEITPGTWIFRITAVTGVLADWDLVVTGVPYSKPDFGDSQPCPPGYDMHGGVCMKH